MAAKQRKRANRYSAIIGKIFFSHYKKGNTEFEFTRSEIEKWARKLRVKLPKNQGDLLYSFRFRAPLPQEVLNTQPLGMQWHIQLAGRARYRFKLARENVIFPRPDLIVIKVPDATPELIDSYALDDEQSLLAIVRYNRLIDIFLGLTTYSLQNHLRTTAKDMGQIEIDELYVGIDTNGCHYVIPVQAKGGSDRISIVQAQQDFAACAEKFPGIKCRAISVQFMEDDVVGMFELALVDDEIKVVEERHYKLVPADDLDQSAVKNYRSR